MMIEWVKALSPIIVAVIPILVAVFKSASSTRKGIETVQKKLDDHITAEEWEVQKQRRLRILRCAYDITNDVQYSTEYLGEIVEDCDEYRSYCESHPDYHNSKGEIAMEIVRDEYLKKLKGDKQ